MRIRKAVSRYTITRDGRDTYLQSSVHADIARWKHRRKEQSHIMGNSPEGSYRYAKAEARYDEFDEKLWELIEVAEVIDRAVAEGAETVG